MFRSGCNETCPSQPGPRGFTTWVVGLAPVQSHVHAKAAMLCQALVSKAPLLPSPAFLLRTHTHSEKQLSVVHYDCIDRVPFINTLFVYSRVVEVLIRTVYYLDSKEMS